MKLAILSAALELLNSKFIALEDTQRALDNYKPDELLAARDAAKIEFLSAYEAVSTVLNDEAANSGKSYSLYQGTSISEAAASAPPVGGVVNPETQEVEVIDRRAPDDPHRLADEAMKQDTGSIT